MAKRKNPLKDLDAFLKKEATSFVNPEKITSQPKEEASPATEKKHKTTTSKEEILAELEALARKEGGDFRKSFYNIIRETLEKLDYSTPADKMLINTILYLNDQPNWKDNIQTYWKNR